MQNFEYDFHISGNFTVAMDAMTESADRFQSTTEKTRNWIEKLNKTLSSWKTFSDTARDSVSRFNDTLGHLTSSGVTLDRKIRELGAASGVTGEKLQAIEDHARNTAKTFGIDAAQAVETYQALLARLSPELAEMPEALQTMGNCIATTSKLMGGNSTAAVEMLTTAMNQYGISLSDPIQAGREMTRLMNTMAAASLAGSASLPTIQAALGQCGTAAQSAGISFEETNAAILLFDQAGKRGAEGGTALQEVFSSLSAIRFLPAETRDELQQAGIDVAALADQATPLQERLTSLQPLLSDNVLLASVFGRANADAARTLIKGAADLQQFTDAVTGTSAAEEQAAAIMDSYTERQARINQTIDDFRIGLFQATGDFRLWVSTITGIIVPISQFIQLISDVGNLMVWIKSLNWDGVWSSIKHFIHASRLQMALMNQELVTGQFESNGFLLNMGRATLAVIRFATVGLFQALKGLGALLLSFVTSGTASATFAGIASSSFGAFKLSAVTACRAVGVAIQSIPIIGWIAAAIAALVALGIYFWKTSAKFRATLKGLGAAFVAVFKGIWELAKNLFGSIGDLIKAAFSFDGDGIKEAIEKMKGGFSDFGSNVGKAFNEAYEAEMTASKKAEEEKKKKEEEEKQGFEFDPNNPTDLPPGVLPTLPHPDPTGGSLQTVAGTGHGNNSGGSGIKNITVHVDKLVERFEIRTTHLTEDLGRVKELVSETLLSALNDVNLAV